MIDYMVMEAVAIKANKEEQEAQKAATREAWKRQKSEELEQLR